MADSRTLQITLRLNDVDELFKRSQITPFSQDYQVHSYTSGIEFIADKLYAHTSYTRVHTTILLPPGESQPDLASEITAAVQRYCRARLQDVAHEIGATRWRGRRLLLMAFVALFVFIGASKLVYNEYSLVLQIISEGLAVAGWVALWFPLELLTFTFWQHRLDRKIYRTLMEMTITVTHLKSEHRSDTASHSSKSS